MRRAAATLALAAVLAASGCSSDCQELGDRICSCEPEASQNTCENTVKDQIASGADQPTGEDQARCAQLLDSCVAQPDADLCTFMRTARGKQACGLAASAPSP